MRFEILRIFGEVIRPHMAQISHVAVVGGSAQEPELAHLSSIPGLQISFLGVEKSPSDDSDFLFFDLNEEMSASVKFDLILCSQVLEHIWNHAQAFENLNSILNPKGLLWIGCPGSNFAHGSPEYFTAGLTPSFIIEHLKSKRFEILHQQSIGSKRYYFLTHALQIWASSNMHKYPLLFGFSRFYPREVLLRLYSSFLSPKIRTDLKYATETIVFARKL